MVLYNGDRIFGAADLAANALTFNRLRHRAVVVTPGRRLGAPALRLDDEKTRLWDAPVHTPALRWGV